jgi:O-acetylhomoserine (thiol)-lyase
MSKHAAESELNGILSSSAQKKMKLNTTSQTRSYSIETTMLHGGQVPDPATGARAVPIYQSSSFCFHNTQHAAELFSLAEPGNIYTRISNPTNDVFEKRMALLEGGVGALATSSGQAALTITMLTILQAGDEIVSSSTLYGGSFHLLADTLTKFGIKSTFVDSSDPENFRQAITDKTRCIYAETIGNPKLNVLDISAVAKIAHDNKIPLIVDSTFTTPYLCQPVKFGADIIIHSATKWIGGHGTSIGGVIIDSGNFDWSKSGKFPGFVKPDASYNNMVYASDWGTLAFIVKARVQIMRDIGSCISPFNTFLLLMGLETLHVRMKEHSKNAMAVAKFLSKHPLVTWVNYPGLPDHTTHEIAKQYFRTDMFGAVVVFGIRGGLEAGKKFIEGLSIWSHLANVGDAKSLVIHPASTTHQQLTKDELEKCGVSEDLIRLAVGLENIDDIITDLDQALFKSAPFVHPENVISDCIDCNDESIIRWVCSSSSQPHGNPPVTRPTVIAVIGLSDKEGRPSYRVARKMQRLGYKIIPINPLHSEILGEKCYKSLAEVDQLVDVIQVFRAKEYSVEIAQEALKVKDRLQTRAFWLQEGVISEEAAQLIGREGGTMKVVMNRCTYKECQRYMGPMATYI